ncbi:MAG: hypothetical protein Q9217_001787 [Psora testacea]
MATALPTFTAVELLVVAFRNYSPGHGRSYAQLEAFKGVVRVTIRSPTRWNIHPGQYINIWMPSLSVSSMFQTHPFVIASWTDSTPIEIVLLVEVRQGFTQTLFDHASNKNAQPEKWFLWHGRPHGLKVPLADFGSILMIATGFGIASQLPVLRAVIRGYNKCEVRARHMHLVWQLNSWGMAALQVRNGIKTDISLEDREFALDTLYKEWEADTHDGYIRHGSIDHHVTYLVQILKLSMYFIHGSKHDKTHESEHGRASYHGGTMSIPDILKEAVTIHPLTKSKDEQQGSTLVTGEQRSTHEKVEKANKCKVSADESTRDAVRSHIRAYVHRDVRLLEMEHQPDSSRGIWTSLWRQPKPV